MEKSPFSMELDDEEDGEAKSALNPMSLLSAAAESAAKAMLLNRHSLSCHKIHAKLSNTLKPMILKEYFIQNRYVNIYCMLHAASCVCTVFLLYYCSRTTIYIPPSLYTH